MNQEKLNKALNLCYFFLKFRPRTKGEIKKYLQKKQAKYHFSDETIKEAIVILEEEGLINDVQFTEWFVKGRIARRPKSEWVLRRELKKYGVEDELIDDYFFKKPIDNEELADHALSQKWRRFKNLEKFARFKKASSFLLRRGFGFAVAKKAIKKLESGRIKTN